MDLFSKYNLNESGLCWSTDAHYAKYRYMVYPNFAFRYWLNEDLYNGFGAGIRDAMCDMQTAYEETVYSSVNCYDIKSIQYINEKVKCPSITELGIRDVNSPSKYISEGSMYPIFSQIAYTAGSSALLKNINGNNAYYWSRSVIPSYYESCVRGPAFILPVNGNNGYYAAISWSGQESNSNYITAVASDVEHNQATVNMGIYIGTVAIGVCAFIRFGNQ